MAKKNRPAGELDGIPTSTLETTSIVADFPASAALERSQGMLLLMVLNPDNGRYRRRIFLSLKAAEKAAHRARERGHTAHVILGQFHAVEVTR